MSWKIVTPNLPRGLQKCGAAYVKGYVFALGGFDDGLGAWSPSILGAKVNSDGTTGPWFVAGAMKARAITGFPAVMVHKDLIVMAGHWDGVIAGQTYSDVAVWRVGTDGSLVQTHAGTMPAQVGAAQICYFRGYVYVLGGIDNSNVCTNHVFRARLNSDGTIGQWEKKLDFPGGRMAGFAAVRGDNVYLLGGVNSSFGTPKTYVGRFNSDGDIVGWQDLGTGLIGRRTQAGICQVGDTVYMVGGEDQTFAARKDTVAVHLGPAGVATVRGPDLGAGVIGDAINLGVVHTGHFLLAIGGFNLSGSADLRSTPAIVPPGDLH